MLNDTRQGEILPGAPGRGRLTVPLCNSRPLFSKLLRYFLITPCSLLLVYNLVPDILRQLFGLARGEEVGI